MVRGDRAWSRPWWALDGVRPKVVALLDDLGRSASPVLGWAGAGVVLALVLVDLGAGPGRVVPLGYALVVGTTAWGAGWRAGVAGASLAAIGTAATSFTRPPGTGLGRALGLGSATLGALLLVVWFVGVLADLLARERRLARRDPLTGLPNRRAVLEAAEAELARAHRTRAPLTVVALDVDGLKRVNDEHGHPAGDALLVAFAATVRAEIRVIDVLGRMGGDEFVLLLPECDAGAAAEVMARVGERLARRGPAGELSACAGWVTFPAPPPSVDVLLASADRLVVAAKRQGPGTVRAEVVAAEVPARLPQRPVAPDAA